MAPCLKCPEKTKATTIMHSLALIDKAFHQFPQLENIKPIFAPECLKYLGVDIGCTTIDDV
jgi:hypothetical protein